MLFSICCTVRYCFVFGLTSSQLLAWILATTTWYHQFMILVIWRTWKCISSITCNILKYIQLWIPHGIYIGTLAIHVALLNTITINVTYSCIIILCNTSGVSDYNFSMNWSTTVLYFWEACLQQYRMTNEVFLMLKLAARYTRMAVATGVNVFMGFNLLLYRTCQHLSPTSDNSQMTYDITWFVITVLGWALWNWADNWNLIDL